MRDFGEDGPVIACQMLSLSGCEGTYVEEAHLEIQTTPRTGCRQEPLGTLGLGPGHGGEVAARELGRPRALCILDTE